MATEAEIKRQQASEERGKRNAASGKPSHQERVATRNEAVNKKNAALAKAHPQAARDSNPLFRRTGTGSVNDRLGKKDTVQADRNKIVAAAQDAYVKEHPKESAAARMGKNKLVDGDRLAAYNRTPVNNGNINASKPGGRQYHRASKGQTGGGRFA